MAKKKVKVSKKVSVGDDDVGASVETHAGASAEVTDSSVSAGRKLVLVQKRTLELQ